jgi:hypothetical protein
VESTDFKVTRITKTKIVLGDLQKTFRDNYSVYRGSIDGQAVSIHVIGLEFSIRNFQSVFIGTTNDLIIRRYCTTPSDKIGTGSSFVRCWTTRK